MSYLRSYKGKAVLVVLNMSDVEQTVKFDLAKEGFAKFELTPLVGGWDSDKLNVLYLEPFGAVIAEVKH